MNPGAAELAFRARALAQAHPLTALARRVVDRAVEDQRRGQPLPELGTWAAVALVQGYCVRRVEEDRAGLVLQSPDANDGTSLDDLEAATTLIAARLRAADAVPASSSLPPDETSVAALDHIIGSEVERRLDFWRDELDDEDCREVEAFLTWWVVRGYALRVAEMATGALR